MMIIATAASPKSHRYQSLSCFQNPFSFSSRHSCFPLHSPVPEQHSNPPPSTPNPLPHISTHNSPMRSILSVCPILSLSVPILRKEASRAQSEPKKRIIAAMSTTCLPQEQAIFSGIGMIIKQWERSDTRVFNLLMESKLIVSRSVLVDPVYQKAQRMSYQKHKLQLAKIKERQCILEDEEAVTLAARKKASIQHSSERVREQFDPRKLENKAMFDHIKSIMKRKVSEVNIYRSYSTVAMKERKEIEKQNEILNEKIRQARNNKLTKRDLRRQFAQYESQKNLLRKVKYDPKPHTQLHQRGNSHFSPNH